MKHIQAVIFDLDGLMIDSEPLSMKAWGTLLAEYGVELGLEDFKSTIGLDSYASARLLKERLELTENVEHLVDRSEEDLLELLRGKGLKLGMASNSPSDYVDAALGAIKMRHFFECVIPVDHVSKGKPAPDPYLAAAECLAVEPGNCLAIEDSPSGMRSALAAGMRCVVIPNADLEASDFAGANARYESLVHLSDKIELELSFMSLQ
jgi:putative hydrolase of the HAD superfamily